MLLTKNLFLLLFLLARIISSSGNKEKDIYYYSYWHPYAWTSLRHNARAFPRKRPEINAGMEEMSTSNAWKQTMKISPSVSVITVPHHATTISKRSDMYPRSKRERKLWSGLFCRVGKFWNSHSLQGHRKLILRQRSNISSIAATKNWRRNVLRDKLRIWN